MAIPGLFVDKTLLMRRACGSPAPCRELQLQEICDVDSMVAHCAAAGRATPADRAARRRDHGLRFFSLLEHGRIVANGWAVQGRPRFLDEAMLLLELGERAACLRDIYVRHEDRGRGLFRAFVEALESGPMVGIRELWSCVEADNEASRSAHAKAAFEVAGEVSTVALFDRLMWRQRHTPPSIRCRDFAAGRSVIWLGRRARAFRRAQLA